MNEKTTGKSTYPKDGEPWFVAVDICNILGLKSVSWLEKNTFERGCICMIGKIAAISVTCKKCGKDFALNRGEIMWYSNMGYPLPKRCPECRAKRRKEREKNEKKIKNAHASQSE